MEFRRIAAGSAGGALATVAMSGWMLAGQVVTAHGEQPPKRLLRGFAHRAGMPTNRRGVVTVLATAVAHLGFGSGCGAVYGAVVSRSSAYRGVAFGLGVWAISYAGWIPALDLLPPPHKDRPGRAWTIFTAHVVYGGALGAVLAGYDKAQHPGSSDKTRA